MHYVYTVYKEGIRYTITHIHPEEIPHQMSRCTPEISPSIRCPKWRYHQLDQLHHEYETPMYVVVHLSHSPMHIFHLYTECMYPFIVMAQPSIIHQYYTYQLRMQYQVELIPLPSIVVQVVLCEDSALRYVVLSIATCHYLYVGRWYHVGVSTSVPIAYTSPMHTSLPHVLVVP